MILSFYFQKLSVSLSFLRFLKSENHFYFNISFYFTIENRFTSIILRKYFFLCLGIILNQLAKDELRRRIFLHERVIARHRRSTYKHPSSPEAIFLLVKQNQLILPLFQERILRS